MRVGKRVVFGYLTKLHWLLEFTGLVNDDTKK